MVWGSIKGGIGRGVDWIGDKLDRTNTGFKEVDPTGQLGQLGGMGVEGFQQRGEQMGDLAQMLQRRAQGEDSLSQEQLRQNLGQLLSQQQSMAAGASPANQAMAARTAANNMGQQAAGMSGQQAMAGIQERQAAQNALGNLLMQQRQQDLGAAQGSLGTIEGARTARHGIGAQQPTDWEHFLGLLQGGAQMATQGRDGGGGGG